MSIREHVSVFIAIIIGLAVSVLTMNFYRLIVAGKKVKWDWLSPLLAVFMLFVTVSYWWASYSWYSKATTLGVYQFLPDLLNVIMLFLAVAGVLPETVPARGIDLRRFYFERSRFVYGIMALCIAEASLLNVVRAHDKSWAGVIDALNINPVFMVMFAVLALTRRVWVHGVLLIVALCGSVGINLTATISS